MLSRRQFITCCLLSKRNIISHEYETAVIRWNCCSVSPVGIISRMRWASTINSKRVGHLADFVLLSIELKTRSTRFTFISIGFWSYVKSEQYLGALLIILDQIQWEWVGKFGILGPGPIDLFSFETNFDTMLKLDIFWNPFWPFWTTFNGNESENFAF